MVLELLALNLRVIVRADLGHHLLPTEVDLLSQCARIELAIDSVHGEDYRWGGMWGDLEVVGENLRKIRAVAHTNQREFVPVLRSCLHAGSVPGLSKLVSYALEQSIKVVAFEQRAPMHKPVSIDDQQPILQLETAQIVESLTQLRDAEQRLQMHGVVVEMTGGFDQQWAEKSGLLTTD